MAANPGQCAHHAIVARLLEQGPLRTRTERPFPAAWVKKPKRRSQKASTGSSRGQAESDALKECPYSAFDVLPVGRLDEETDAGVERLKAKMLRGDHRREQEQESVASTVAPAVGTGDSGSRGNGSDNEPKNKEEKKEEKKGRNAFGEEVDDKPVLMTQTQYELDQQATVSVYASPPDCNACGLGTQQYRSRPYVICVVVCMHVGDCTELSMYLSA